MRFMSGNKVPSDCCILVSNTCTIVINHIFMNEYRVKE